jgi:hypothetical protein
MWLTLKVFLNHVKLKQKEKRKTLLGRNNEMPNGSIDTS